MAFQQRRHNRRNKRLFQDVSQWFAHQIRDQAGQKLRVVGGFNGHRQLHGWLGHFHGFFRTLKLGAVNNIGPANQLFNGMGIKAKFLLCHMRQKFGAGSVFRVEKLPAFIAKAIMVRVFRREECALMMVKPPGDLWRRGIFKIDDGVLVAIEISLIEESARAMDQSGELEVHVRPDAFAVEARKQRGRGRPVKTFAVKKDPDLQKTFLYSEKLNALSKATRYDIPAR